MDRSVPRNDRGVDRHSIVESGHSDNWSNSAIVREVSGGEGERNIGPESECVIGFWAWLRGTAAKAMHSGRQNEDISSDRGYVWVGYVWVGHDPTLTRVR